MAGDWIKMRNNLWDDPRVSRLCDITGSKEACIVGGLYWLWASADEHSEDGFMPGLSAASVDRKTGVKGLGKALLEIGWITEVDCGVRIERFGEHNGVSAKRRGMDAQRKAGVRKTSAFEADKERTETGQDAGNRGAREEKRREDKEISHLSVAPARPPDEAAGEGGQQAIPDCPHKAILALWHEVLPALPQHLPEHWRGTRADHLRARWREAAAGKNWASEADGLAYFRRLFAYVGQSRFLTGRVPSRDAGKAAFVIELEWLVTPANWAKVHEGKYHQEAA